jgi:hypothetical protein
MNDLRFVITAVAVFAAAFGGMWLGLPLASKGLALIAAGSQPAKHAAAPPAIAETNAERGLAVAAVRHPVSTAAPEADNVVRDHLAQSALAAANAYARAPCDRMAKAAFIVAASTYLRANTQAPRDVRLHEAIKAAFEGGHVGSDEFPPDTMFAGRSSSASADKTGCVNSAGLRP